MTTLEIGELTLIPASDLADAGTLTGVETVVVQRGTALPALRTSTQQIANLAGTLTTAVLKSNNLSDLPSIATARTNLGLGGAALLNVGTTTGTVAAGDDARLSDARNPNGTISAGDLAGSSYPSPTIAKINGVAIGANPLTQYALNADNLSGLASATTARTNLGLGNVDNTSDANKPVSSATTTQLNLKAPLASPTFTGTVTIPTGASITAPTGLVKGDVGLGNVDNTADTAKPVSTAQQTALNLKANLASPTFTGTVTIPTGASIIAPTGLVKGDVGLGNVDNTSNVTERAATATLTNKSISGSANTITNIGQASVTNLTSDLALKAPLASPTFTGSVTIGSPALSAGTAMNAQGSLSVENGFLGLCFIATQYQNGQATIDLRSVGGTAGSPTKTPTGTVLGGMHIGGCTANGLSGGAPVLNDVAQFYCVATENYDSTHMGSRWEFYTNPNASSLAKALAFTIEQDQSVTCQGNLSIAGNVTSAVVLTASGTALTVNNDALVVGNLTVSGSIIAGGPTAITAVAAANTFANTTTNKYVVSDTNAWSATASQAAHATNTTVDSNPSFATTSGSAGVWTGGGFASLRSRFTLTGNDQLDNRWGIKFEDAVMTAVPNTKTITANYTSGVDQINYSTAAAGDVGATVAAGSGIASGCIILSVIVGASATVTAGKVTGSQGAISKVLTLTTSSTPTITNQYGLYFPTMTAASNNYAIYSLAPVYFSGSSFDASGNATFAGTLAMAGTLTGVTNVLTLDGTFKTITSAFYGWNYFSTAAGGQNMLMRRARGTAGAESKVLSGDGLQTLSFAGWNDTNGAYLNGATIAAVTTQDFTSTGYRGTQLNFATAVNSSNTAAATRLIIGHDGKVYFGSSTSATTSIDQSGNALFAGTLGVTGHVTLESVTSTGATGTGNVVFATSPTFTTPTLGVASGTSLVLAGALSGVTTLSMGGALSGATNIVDLSSPSTNAIGVVTASLGLTGIRNYAGGGTWQMARVDGTTGAGTPVLTGETLFNLAFAGATTTSATPTIYSGVILAAVATETFSGTAGGTKLTISTTANTTHTRTTALTLDQDQSATFGGNVSLTTTNTLTLGEGGNVVVGTTTGTSFGSAITQKLSFYGVTPVVQRANANQAAAPAGGTGATAGAYDTAAHRDAHIALTNEIRTVLVNVGLMKGSA